MNFKNLSCCIVFILSFLQSYAQEKSVIYFDKEWKKTTKDNAAYYRNLPLEVQGDSVLIKDYYISGTLQMIGWAEKENEDSFIGAVKWFYENRNVSTISNFHYGTLDGLHEEFYENGNKKFIVNYIGHAKEGEAKFFNSEGVLTSRAIYKNDRPYEGTTNCFATYKNGKSIERKLFYENTQQLAYEKHTSNTIIKETYYEKNGKKLREVITDSELEKQDGFKGSYYPGSTCGYVLGMQHFKNIKNGNLEGDEYFYTPDGSVLYHGSNKDGSPYEGAFYKKSRSLIYLTTYKKGIKTKEEIISNNTTVAKGTYVEGEKFNGTFITETKIHGYVCSKISTLKNGKEEGKQVFERIESGKSLGYYYAKNGVKHGESYDYNHKSDTAYILYYKKGIAMEGELLGENGNILIYKDGKLDTKKVKSEMRNTEFFEIYKNEKKIGVEYSIFEIDGQNKQTGIYRNNEPYEGYFLETPPDFAVILNYYEKGVKKYQYAKLNMSNESEEEITIPMKSLYKNDTIYTGVQFSKTSNDSFSFKILEKGEIKAISIWVFAIHYANNLVFKKTDEGMEVVEIKNEDLKIVVTKEFISLTYEGKVIDQRKRNTTNDFNNKITTFYLDKGVLKSDIFWCLSPETTKKVEREKSKFRSDFLMRIYAILPSKNTIEHTFKKFSTDDFIKNSVIDYIANIYYDEVGKPTEGILIKEKKGVFNAEFYSESQLKESKKSLTIDKLKEQITIWHKKQY